MFSGARVRVLLYVLWVFSRNRGEGTRDEAPKTSETLYLKKEFGSAVYFSIRIAHKRQISQNNYILQLVRHIFGQSSMKFEYKPLILKEKNKTSKQQKQVGDRRPEDIS